MYSLEIPRFLLQPRLRKEFQHFSLVKVKAGLQQSILCYPVPPLFDQYAKLHADNPVAAPAKFRGLSAGP